jgi:adenine-specific DNA methylase
MPEIVRELSAVFRFYPDPRGDIRIIHNGHSRLEVDETIEALWFEIDNQRTLSQVYQSFCNLTGRQHDPVTAALFADILREFELAGLIRRNDESTTCLACGRVHRRSDHLQTGTARFRTCKTCHDQSGILAWWCTP